MKEREIDFFIYDMAWSKVLEHTKQYLPNSGYKLASLFNKFDMRLNKMSINFDKTSEKKMNCR